MNKGELIEDNIVNQVLTDKFTSLKGEDILIDGYPRSLKQAEFLNKLLVDETSKIVFNFNVEKNKFFKNIKKDHLENLNLKKALIEKAEATLLNLSK